MNLLKFIRRFLLSGTDSVKARQHWITAQSVESPQILWHGEEKLMPPNYVVLVSHPSYKAMWEWVGEEVEVKQCPHEPGWDAERCPWCEIDRLENELTACQLERDALRGPPKECSCEWFHALTCPFYRRPGA